MPITYVKIFKDKEKLDKMLNLRRQGWTYKSLGLMFGADHSSIYRWCKLKRIPIKGKKIVFSVANIISLVPISVKKIKTYQDYLLENKHRNLSQAHLSRI